MPPSGRRLDLLEATAFMLAVKVALLAFGFRRLSPYLGRPGGAQPTDGSEAGPGGALHVRAAIKGACRRLPRRPSCLVRSITAHLMLRRRGLPSALSLGLDRPEAGGLGAHAWVHSGRLCVIGCRNEGFAVVQRFVWID